MSRQTTHRSAIYIIFKRADELLMLRRFNTGYQDGNYSLVAGHIEANESALHAALREGSEEAGVTLRAEDLRVVHVMHRVWEDRLMYYDVYFLAEQWEGEITNLEPEKCDDLRWFKLDSLPDNTVGHVRLALSCVQERVSFSEYGWESK